MAITKSTNEQGIYTFPDGSRYIGEFKDGEKHGQGTFVSPNGETYEGEYKDGLPNGQGIYTSGKLRIV